ncbi:hypothetical protein BJX61DRAFT_516658 [Aspergillus egyptiacus]|nr:hypothetical protein BJX61DRAFT_516658 [Aspergillus egyptiacus]
MKPTAVLSFLPFAHYALANLRSGPSLMDTVPSPARARALLEKRDTCESGNSCLFRGSCCGYDSCAYECCGIAIDGQPVGCGPIETCDYAKQSVFIGCCNYLNVGGCYGTATEITMSTIYGEVTATDEPSSTSTSREPTLSTTTTTVDEPTATSSPRSQTSLPTETSSSSSTEDSSEASSTDSDTSTSMSITITSPIPTSPTSTTSDASTAPEETSTPTSTISTPTETDAAAGLNPGLWLAAGLGAMLFL